MVVSVTIRNYELPFIIVLKYVALKSNYIQLNVSRPLATNVPFPQNTSYCGLWETAPNI